MPGGTNLLYVKRDEWRAGLNVVALLDQHVKAITAHLDGVDTNVDEHLHAVVRGEPQGVPGIHGRRDCARDRRIYDVSGGLDGHTRTQHPLCEDWIRHLGERRCNAINRSENTARLRRGGNGTGYLRRRAPPAREPVKDPHVNDLPRALRPSCIHTLCRIPRHCNCAARRLAPSC